MKYKEFTIALNIIKMVSKKSIMLLIALALVITVKAQDKPNKEVVTIDMDKYKILIIQKDTAASESDTAAVEDDEDKHKHWSGVYLGVNGYSTPSNSLDVPNQYDFLELDYSKSIHFAINFMDKDIQIYKEYVKIVTGLGIDWNSYSFKNNIRLVPNSDVIAAVTDSVADFEKNKLKTTFVTLPLLLAFNTNEDPEKAFHFAAGAVLGYKLGSKTKQKYTIEDETYKPKIKSNYNLFPFKYELTVRVGYGNFNLYATHALSPLFEDGEGPKLHPFTMGIRLTSL